MRLRKMNEARATFDPRWADFTAVSDKNLPRFPGWRFWECFAVRTANCKMRTRLCALPRRAFPFALRIRFPRHHARIGYRTVAAPGADRSTSRPAASPAARDQHTAFRAGHPAEAQASPVVIRTVSLLPRPAARWRRDTAPGNLSDRAANRHRVRAIGSAGNDSRHR